MGFKELREKFHEKDRDFSSHFYKIDKLNGVKRISWRNIILTWFLVVLIFSFLTVVPITLFHSDYSINNEGLSSNISNNGSIKSFSNSYFSMDYPSNFTIKEANSYSISFSGGVNTWIEVWRFSSSNSLSYEVDKTKNDINSGNGKTLGSTKSIIVNGIEGYEIRASYPDSGLLTYILVEKNGYIFTLRFSGLIDDNTKNLVIDSFKFK
jgi:hypothetical protein